MPGPSTRLNPSLALAVQDPALRRRLERVSAAAGLQVVDADVEDVATGTPGQHLLVVERPQLVDRQSVSRLLERTGGVVVLAEGGDPADRAELLAAGVTQILDPGSSDEELARSLASLSSADAQGGSDGPEVHGHDAEPHLADFASRSPRMLAFLDVVHRVADTDAALLITGETGVGKERLARAMHADSARQGRPFVGVNVGALPENLLEDELFGHEPGAFTGASTARLGRFERADGGTIFLDEIGELSPHLQVKLLTVLQRHVVQRLGAERPRPVDVRVMAATNRDLGAEVAAGRFREDLFYRLNVVPLVIPPLRERPEDIPNLAGSFLGWFREATDRPDLKGFTAPAMDALIEHSWPGNVRELINLVERAVLLSRGPRIGLDDLPRDLRRRTGRARRGDADAASPPTGPRPHAGPQAPAIPSEPQAPTSDDPLPEGCGELPLREARRIVVDRFERAYLDQLLRRTGGRVGDTARLAGISSRSLYDKMRRHGLHKEDYR